MPQAYADIAFTPNVRAMQSAMGSRDVYARRERDPHGPAVLGAEEAAFVAARDSFYLATLGETGWPYVQFKGGPAGFLEVVDERTLGYADFRGNVQYISDGNLKANDRVALILVDHAHRRRLKVYGRARLVDRTEDPALLARLERPDYRARVERAVVIAVEAFDWNCPQHITPRFTEAEIDAASAPLRAELVRLQAEVAELRGAAARQGAAARSR